MTNTKDMSDDDLERLLDAALDDADVAELRRIAAEGGIHIGPPSHDASDAEIDQLLQRLDGANPSPTQNAQDAPPVSESMPAATAVPPRTLADVRAILGAMQREGRLQVLDGADYRDCTLNTRTIEELLADDSDAAPTAEIEELLAGVIADAESLNFVSPSPEAGDDRVGILSVTPGKTDKILTRQKRKRAARDDLTIDFIRDNWHALVAEARTIFSYVYEESTPTAPSTSLSLRSETREGAKPRALGSFNHSPFPAWRDLGDKPRVYCYQIALAGC
jgi:hypothetical protein